MLNDLLRPNTDKAFSVWSACASLGLTCCIKLLRVMSDAIYWIDHSRRGLLVCLHYWLFLLAFLANIYNRGDIQPMCWMSCLVDFSLWFFFHSSEADSDLFGYTRRLVKTLYWQIVLEVVFRSWSEASWEGHIRFLMWSYYLEGF